MFSVFFLFYRIENTVVVKLINYDVGNAWLLLSSFPPHSELEGASHLVEVGLVLLEQKLFELGSLGGQVGQAGAALNVQKVFEERVPHVGSPPSFHLALWHVETVGVLVHFHVVAKEDGVDNTGHTEVIDLIGPIFPLNHLWRPVVLVFEGHIELCGGM